MQGIYEKDQILFNSLNRSNCEFGRLRSDFTIFKSVLIIKLITKSKV